MFDTLLFLYFFTLHADQLSYTVGGFTIRLNNFIAAIVLLLFFTRFRTQLFQIDRALFFALLFLTATISLSFLLSPYKQRCIFFLLWYGVTIVGYLIFPYLLIRYYEMRKVFQLYLLSFVAVGLFAFLQLLLSFFRIQAGATQFIAGRIVRADAWAYEPSYYALYMTPFIVLVNYHFLAERREPFFILGKLNYPKILFLNFLYFLSTATTAFFAFIIFCASLFLFRHVRRSALKFCAVFATLFFLLALLAPFLMKKYFLKFFFAGFMQHGSFFERWRGIETAWKVFQAHPVCGVGLGGYPAYLYEAILGSVSAFGSKTFEDLTNPLKALEATNVGTEILASLGILGGLGFTLLFCVCVTKARKAFIWDRTLSCGLMLSVIVMVIVLQFNQGILRTYVWVHLALAIAIMEKIGRERKVCSSPEIRNSKQNFPLAY